MNNDNDENFPNIFNITNNRITSQTSYDDLMINQLTNMLTNRIINNENIFFPLQSRSNFNISNILQNSLYQSNPYKKVTSDSGLSQIKTIIFKDSQQETKECAITQEEFQEGQEIAQLPCKHIFDKDAIKTWLKEESNSCPICRYELDFKEINKKEESLDTSRDVLTDSDDDIPDLIEELPEVQDNNEDVAENVSNLEEMTYEEAQRELQSRREDILTNINRIIRNIQFINEPHRLHRQQSFNTDRDLQYALMASLNESQTQSCEEKNEEDFIVHPDTQHDEFFNDILSDVDSDNELNQVD
tara:strand:- start:5679 stop:6581 length:903 start_codon:yes stop_codon:yes gene_type:complete